MSRYNLEKVVYGRMENIGRENETKYAVYAKQKEQEKVRHYRKRCMKERGR